MAMQHHQISLGNSAFEMDLLARIPLLHPLEIGDKGVFAVTNFGIVLDVRIAGVFFHGLARFALIEHQIIKVLRCPFVAIKIFSHLSHLFRKRRSPF